MAKLIFRYGAMNCGKSTQLLQVAHNYEEQKMNIVIIKPKVDTKGNDYVISRLGIKRKVDFSICNEDNVYEIIKHLVEVNTLNSVNAVLVDEVQFLQKEQIDQLMQITGNLNIPVICYGLRTDFKTNGFEGSNRLLQIAHNIEELKTICECGKKATFNIRKINNKLVFNGSQIAIDDNAKIEYISVCSDCYFKNKH